MASTVVVVTGAAPLTPAAIAALPAGAVVVAADGGLDHALGAGLAPQYLVGDLDSVTAAGLMWASRHAEVVRHPVDKAATDTELAVGFAAGLGADHLVLVAGGGDRIDHAVAALGALGAPELASLSTVEAWWGDDHLTVVHGPGRCTLDAPAGTTFSLLSMHGSCGGVEVTGARWPLHGTDLGPLIGVGVSNQVVDPPAEISVVHGILTVIVPGDR